MMRRMPPDGLCLYHAVKYACNPDEYHKVDATENGMLIGAGSEKLFQAAADLRQELIDAAMARGRIEQATRLMKSGSEGYPEEEDFPLLACISSLPFEIVIEAAPAMEPMKYGDGEPRARFILRDILDGAGHRSSHWDVDAVYARGTKRRRITGRCRMCTAGGPAKFQPDSARDPGIDFLIRFCLVEQLLRPPRGSEAGGAAALQDEIQSRNHTQISGGLRSDLGRAQN